MSVSGSAGAAVATTPPRTGTSSAAGGRRRIGRYEVQRELGRGAQATVWLGWDPRLEREVALKLLSADADASTRAEWLNEGRSAATLKHPNVVPVFEADEDQGQPYLVFEYVEGGTLAGKLKQRPRWPAREAVGLMLGVLDALAAAHAQGIVHRDLKPSNILIGADGRPRVMDFGIAARVSGGAAAHDGRIVGTPGYISPEAARGEPPQPAMDVFAAGVMLGEMLSGGPLLRERDPWRAVQRVQDEDLQLPAGSAGGDADAALRAIVQRALARDPRERFDGAKTLHEALHGWLNPEHETLDSSHATLEFLLRRMRHKSDFPALSSSVVRIQRLATSDTERLSSLSDEILKDVALTNKLLRMVNTVHFTAVTGEPVSTVSRAVALVGMAGIRNMALSIVLMEHMHDKEHAALLKDEFLRALMAGTLASDLTPLARDAEEAFLASMFQNLGRLLTEYYFPDEAQKIRQLVAGPKPVTRDAAARRLLGLSLDELGAGVAKSWGLAETLQRAMRAPAGEVPLKAVDPKADRGIERLRWLGRGANEITDAMLSADGEMQVEAIGRVADTFAPALGLDPRELTQMALGARTRLAHLSQAMGIHLAPGSAARRLLRAEPDAAQLAAARAAAEAPTIAMAAPASEASAAAAVGGPGQAEASASASALAGAGPLIRLSTGLESLRTAMAGGQMKVNEVLSLVLETLHGSLGLRRVVFCIRDPRSGQLVGRASLGEGAAAVQGSFRVAPTTAGQPDLFAACCARGADVLIADSRTVAPRLPAWFRDAAAAPTFLLLPMMLKGQAVGLIYADKGAANALVLGAAELALVKSLRDQAVQALTG